MKWLHRRRLKRLLSQGTQHESSELVQSAYLAAMKGGLFHYETGIPMTRNLIEIYERRSKYQHLSTTSTREIEAVLENLKKIQDNRVRLHGLVANNTGYTVFTNLQTTTLIGILILGKPEASRMVPPTSPD